MTCPELQDQQGSRDNAWARRSHVSWPGLGTSWVPARSLWQQQNKADNKGRDDKRGERTAEGKTAITDRLVQKVSDSGA
jgi:hypothetical protein